ncbi:MAG: DUF4172 domain-containing protein, partial [Acidobacteriota bacterium]
MKWNWQKPDWPDFSWDAARLQGAEEQFLQGNGMFAGIVKHMGAPDQEQL